MLPKSVLSFKRLIIHEETAANGKLDGGAGLYATIG